MAACCEKRSSPVPVRSVTGEANKLSCRLDTLATGLFSVSAFVLLHSYVFKRIFRLVFQGQARRFGFFFFLSGSDMELLIC